MSPASMSDLKESPNPCTELYYRVINSMDTEDRRFHPYQQAYKQSEKITEFAAMRFCFPLRSSRLSTTSTLVDESYPQFDSDKKHAPLDTTPRLNALRSLMKQHGFDFYVVPTDDAHQSEYVSPTDKRRQFISGFTGSAGTAVVSATQAWLVTDSRYWIQASEEMDENWVLVKARSPGLPRDWVEWITTVAKNSVIGIDPRTISYASATTLAASVNKVQSKVAYSQQNLVDIIWDDKPKRSQAKVFLHGLEFTGEHAKDKIKRLREWIASQESDEGDSPKAMIVTGLPDIAWTLNLRGSDIPFNPVFFSYFYLSTESAILFIDSTKLTEDVSTYLADLDIETKDYDDVWEFLKPLREKVIITTNTSYAISIAINYRDPPPPSPTPTPIPSPSSQYALILPNQIEKLKSIKNTTELAGFRNAYLRDGACFAQYAAAQRLDALRGEAEFSMGLAYENISATGPNAALPHYAPSEETGGRIIDVGTPYLNDSGGQYLDGTCDTTRTYHFGTPSEEQKVAYTKVLQGHIALDRAVFPRGTTGLHLDVLARRRMWEGGLNYGHGTGHGIGQFLGVHEGPHGFGIHVPFEEGQVVTNEPGYYKEGEFGVRIESTLIVGRVEMNGEKNGEWLGFERITCVPVDVRMIKGCLMDREEKVWVKEHNEECLKKLKPLLKGDKVAMKWLKKQAWGAKKLVWGL
ncbi:hypothetical protein VNI00_005170 [Paramarasmius palmivorus]|uniref:Creatinase/aminopeptidase n=1 Tax=Paramarasmius palmivorus TaxID=297713 RepID=A0AAW0DHV5_9AGAR